MWYVRFLVGSLRQQPSLGADKRIRAADEVMPCTSCVEAKAECRTTSIPQKRGPRPRSGPGSSTSSTPTPLEARLAHLESLLAARHDIVEGSSGLSEAEKKEIHRAVKAPPDDELSDSPTLASSGWREPSFPTPNWNGRPEEQQWGATPGGAEPRSTMALSFVAPTGADTFAAPGFGQHRRESQHGFNSPSFRQSETLQFPPLHPPPGLAPANGQSETASVPGSSTSSRRNLIYRDKDDQLKFLGPSSGLPLLELLKELRESSSGTIDMSPETWEAQQPASAAPPPLDPADEALTAKLWAQVAEALPSELMHELIRGYFNVSHLPYLNPSTAPPEFLPLVLSMCCLSTRSLDSPLLSPQVAPRIFSLCRRMLREDLQGRTTLPIVCALFNLAVFAEGTETPSRSLLLLSQAVTLSIDMGLHRRVDTWAGFNWQVAHFALYSLHHPNPLFSSIELEVRKRLFWAIYCMSVKACTTFGRPPMIRLVDVDVPEPVAVDDAYLTAESIGQQPVDKPSIQAGFVAAIRLHMLLERVLEVINSVNHNPLDTSFRALVLDSSQPVATFPSDLLINTFARDLPGDWTFTPAAINDSDTVRFFQRTRAYALQQFVRLLIARHRLLFDVEQSTSHTDGSGPTAQVIIGEAESLTLQQITQAALGIVGCYATIKARGRLRFFGVHAIAQLTQAGSSLIGVILHTQRASNPRERQLAIIGSEGLAGCVGVLRHLGERRPAGTRSADILEEFARASGVGGSSTAADSPAGMTPDDGSSKSSSDSVPLVRPLSHRETIRRPTMSSPAPLPSLDPSTLDWMLETAFGGTQDAVRSPGEAYGYAFRPPPRFEVDATGGWAPHQHAAAMAGASDVGPAVWHGREAGSDYQWNNVTW
ncbi:hypothetical protein P7C70_g6140, partial [Phenoliferia sp. Uapishka_3]